MSSSVSAHNPARQKIGRARQSPVQHPRPRAFTIEHDLANQVLWTSLSRTGPAHISFDLLADSANLSSSIRDGRYGALRYRVIASDIPSIFSLGGDLEFFVESIEAGDVIALRRYGHAAVDEIWANLTGSGNPGTVTVAVVEGDAQGGGVEAALSCHVVIAEVGTTLGFPESLFGLFPGMGAEQLLAARTDASVAARLISNPNRYSADFLYEIGVLDYLVTRGEGRLFARELVAAAPSRHTLQRAGELKAIAYPTLIRTVDAWVDTAMNLSHRNLRAMRYLLHAQKKLRLSPELC